MKERRWREFELSERDRALCEVAEKLSATPTKMIEADWAPLRRLGLSETGLLEVAHVVGIFNYLTRLADGFGLVLDDAVEQASKTGQPLQRVPADAPDEG